MTLRDSWRSRGLRPLALRAKHDHLLSSATSLRTRDDPILAGSFAADKTPNSALNLLIAILRVTESGNARCRATSPSSSERVARAPQERAPQPLLKAVRVP